MTAGSAIAQQPAVNPSATPVAGEASIPPSMGYYPENGVRGGDWWARFKYRLHACFLGFSEEFEPVPLGSCVFTLARTQVANAEAANMVLYQADFKEGTD